MLSKFLQLPEAVATGRLDVQTKPLGAARRSVVNTVSLYTGGPEASKGPGRDSCLDFLDCGPSSTRSSDVIQMEAEAEPEPEEVTNPSSLPAGSTEVDVTGLALAATTASVLVKGILLLSMTPGGLGPMRYVAPPSMMHNETFAELIFPGFDSRSFIWRVSCLQVLEFISSLAVGQQNGAPATCTLFLMGASWGPSIAKGGLWRLIAPMGLHANMLHLFFNIFFQLRMGFGMERQFGFKKFMSLYMLCGLVGNLISVAVDPFKLAVGASTAGFGLVGVWLAEIFLSWHVLGPHRDRTMVWVAFVTVGCIVMSTMQPNIDMFGHFGGALAGFLAATMISDMPDQYKPRWYDAARVGSGIALASLIGICGAKIGLYTPTWPVPDCGSLLTPHKW
ncbi:Rhomboid- protein 2 [Perkinsus olseni]|uniref:Rhomboid-like protease n=2 Tax=Perkinsus olseni TaxID=32597 RepID=A0A7J6PGU7_PEROL|nr:Rhomboid- protein 2 [Perkinsus olseni]